MEPFRVALSGDFRKADGAPTFPSFDLAPLKSDPKIEIKWVDPVGGVMPAQGLAGCDALILLAPRMAKESFPGDGRLAAIARFGVGYDNVDLAACNEHGVAAIITAGMGPDGTPRASIGTKAPEVAELFADSGPATPSIAPCPNFSGCLETRRSIA